MSSSKNHLEQPPQPRFSLASGGGVSGPHFSNENFCIQWTFILIPLKKFKFLPREPRAVGATHSGNIASSLTQRGHPFTEGKPRSATPRSIWSSPPWIWPFLSKIYLGISQYLHRRCRHQTFTFVKNRSKDFASRATLGRWMRPVANTKLAKGAASSRSSGVGNPSQPDNITSWFLPLVLWIGFNFFLVHFTSLHFTSLSFALPASLPTLVLRTASKESLMWKLRLCRTHIIRFAKNFCAWNAKSPVGLSHWEQNDGHSSIKIDLPNRRGAKCKLQGSLRLAGSKRGKLMIKLEVVSSLWFRFARLLH
jgi:hypothetical protein